MYALTEVGIVEAIAYTSIIKHLEDCTKNCVMHQKECIKFR